MPVPQLWFHLGPEWFFLAFLSITVILLRMVGITVAAASNEVISWHNDKLDSLVSSEDRET